MLKTVIAEVTLVSLLLALGSGACASELGAPARVFRVMTYNIHHGEGLDRKVDLQRIAELIKREQADIVALQEVDKGTERTGRRDFPAEFTALTGLACVFSNNYSFQGGEYGNAVLSRFPVKAATNTLYRMPAAEEPRGILQVVLEARGTELVFMSTHLDFKPDDRDRVAKVAEIRALLKHWGGKPAILCGDLNDVPASRACQALTGSFIDAWNAAGAGDGFTIPATGPRKRIDYIWISKGSSLVPTKTWVPRSEASDHLPVVAEFGY